MKKFDEIDKKIYKDCVLVGISPKNVPIHPGHIALIIFAKTLGPVIVQITIGHIQYMDNLVFGKSTQVEDVNLDVEIKSIEALGVNVVVREYTDNQFNNVHPRNLEMRSYFERNIHLIKNLEIPDYKVKSCLSRLMEFFMFPRNLEVKTWVRGLDLENFIVRHLTKKTKYPRPSIVIFPEVVKDKFGLRYRTTTPFTEEEIIMLRENPSKYILDVWSGEGEVFDGKLTVTRYAVGTHYIEDYDYVSKV